MKVFIKKKRLRLQPFLFLLRIVIAMLTDSLHSGEQSVRKDSEYAQALHKVVEAKGSVLPSLSPEIQYTIEKLMDVQMDAAVLAERDAFAMGFRLAVQIMVAATVRRTLVYLACGKAVRFESYCRQQKRHHPNEWCLFWWA